MDPPQSGSERTIINAAGVRESKAPVVAGALSLRLLLRLLEALVDLRPVHHVPPCGQIFRPAVLILQVISVLPNIVAQNGEVSLRQRAVLVRTRNDLQLSIPDQPAPPGAELFRGGFVELLLEILKAAKVFLDLLADR